MYTVIRVLYKLNMYTCTYLHTGTCTCTVHDLKAICTHGGCTFCTKEQLSPVLLAFLTGTHHKGQKVGRGDLKARKKLYMNIHVHVQSVRVHCTCTYQAFFAIPASYPGTGRGGGRRKGYERGKGKGIPSLHLGMRLLSSMHMDMYMQYSHLVTYMYIHTPLTGWQDSDPHWSHVYVATTMTGLTSVVRVTIPLTVTSFPMQLAITLRTESTLVLTFGLKFSSLQKK